MFKLDIDNGNLRNSAIVSNIEFLQEPDFLCVVGSRLYGTETEGSDLDVRGFTFLPPEYLLGVKRFDLHQNVHSGDDLTIWSVEKFIRMLLAGSTVAFEMLSCPEEMIIRKSDLAAEIIRHRAKFVSKKVVKSMLAYAQSEWRKVLGETTRDLGAKRKQHIAETGYSYKNAYHALRILRSGSELGREGCMSFPVPIAGYLRAVKEGKVDFKDVESSYTGRLALLEKRLRMDKPRDKPDTEAINKLLCQLNLRHILKDLVPAHTWQPIFFQPMETIP